MKTDKECCEIARRSQSFFANLHTEMFNEIMPDLELYGPTPEMLRKRAMIAIVRRRQEKEYARITMLVEGEKK